MQGSNVRGWRRILGAALLSVLVPAIAAAQGPIVNGTTHTGSILAGGEVDEWTLTATINDSITIMVGEVLVQPDANFRPLIRLLDPNGLQIASSLGTNAAHIDLRAPLTGSYTLRVSANEAGQIGTVNYILTLARTGAPYTISGNDEGGALTNGANHSGTIGVGDLDIWTFQATINDSFTVSMGEVLVSGQPDPAFRPWLRVRGPDGATLDSSLGANAAQVDMRAPLTGTYTVLASAFDLSGQVTATNYVVSLARTAGPYTVSPGDEGGALTNGATHPGTAGVGDVDVWTIQANINDNISVMMGEVLDSGQPDPAFRPWIRLRGPDGAPLASTLGTNAALVDVRAPLTGTYTVLVGAFDASAQVSPVPYVLTSARTGAAYTVSPGDQGGAITNGANHAGTTAVGDMDVWTIQANINDSLTVSLGEILDPGQPDPGFRPWIRLKGPDGTSLDTSLGGNAAQIDLRVTLTGTYTILVGGFDFPTQVSPVNYVLTAARTPGPYVISQGDDGGPMTNTINHAGVIGVGDIDTWTFVANQGSPISLNVSEILVAGVPDPQFRPWIRLRGPDGAFIGSGLGTDSANISITSAPSTGVYTVLVGALDFGIQTVPVGYRLSVTGALSPERITVGLGPWNGDGGWFTARRDVGAQYGLASWTHLPWGAYNARGGGLHVAAGDVDGDGLDELVVGLGPGGDGWIAVFDDAAHNFAFLKWIQVAWGMYNASNGEVWPAVGDIDGDGRAEIVAGLGQGSSGWIEIFDDASGGYGHLAWRQVPWSTYTASGKGTHPSIGNVDGAGASEIVVGLEAGGAGWVEVLSDSTGGYAHQAWLQVDWPAYNAANGTTFPAAGDVDGDGRAEIVLGLGAGSGGWLEILQDGAGNYAHLFWLRTSWSTYNTSTGGETHPAVGNVDADARAEIVIGLGQFQGPGGWLEVVDDASATYASLMWINVDWAPFGATGGGTFPAVGRFR